ncbi:hypothetical protein CV102_20535 [Natronococcus pandeyae]|uniref:Uncharacterized protein n=1 Tax=Natronococcus pandeyae TaxID=2055836 RepID=A0A8J8TP07_9EURY|nr:hypothetical protein [Natronococcus pandeyae]TYL36893.1 hypothetical protein CV102_20535 [Natronococcus pandeyae]
MSGTISVESTRWQRVFALEVTHDVRSDRVTTAGLEGIPHRVVGDRFEPSNDVLEHRFVQRTIREKTA